MVYTPKPNDPVSDQPQPIAKKSTRLAEVASNMRYAFQGWWHYEVQFKSDSEPAFLLGKQYNSEPQISSSSSFGFQTSLERIPWMTYRSGFRPMLSFKEKTQTHSEVVSDVGWGCTIRVGQMLLLTTLKRSIGNYRATNFSLLKSAQEYVQDAPYSLHKVVEVARKISKQAGDWFSPADMSFMLEVPHT